MKCISFDEIVQGRDANVRVTDDGYLYAVDLSMVMTGADRNYAGQVFGHKSLSWKSHDKLFAFHDKNLIAEKKL